MPENLSAQDVRTLLERWLQWKATVDVLASDAAIKTGAYHQRHAAMRRVESEVLSKVLKDVEALLTASPRQPSDLQRLEWENADLRDALARVMSEPALQAHGRLLSEIARWLSEQGKESHASALAGLESGMHDMWRELQRYRAVASSPRLPEGTA